MWLLWDSFNFVHILVFLAVSGLGIGGGGGSMSSLYKNECVSSRGGGGGVRGSINLYYPLFKMRSQG